MWIFTGLHVSLQAPKKGRFVPGGLWGEWGGEKRTEFWAGAKLGARSSQVLIGSEW